MLQKKPTEYKKRCLNCYHYVIDRGEARCRIGHVPFKKDGAWRCGTWTLCIDLDVKCGCVNDDPPCDVCREVV